MIDFYSFIVSLHPPVRPGTVYRLYSRNAFYHYMPMFEQGELARSPLDNTILSLRDMLNEAVTPILLDCLEPPDISTIERSFQSLHASNFISSPTDEGVITSLGSLVVALGIDLTLGALVGIGIQFGVAPEAIQLAAILSFPKTPWAVSSPMYHDTDTFNEIVSKTFVSRCHFDAGLFSEPMAISNLLHAYSSCKDKKQFCWKHKVVASRMGHLHGTIESLKRRVAERLGVSPQALEIESPPYQNETKLNILRILQCWMFYDTMIVQSPSKSSIKAVGGAVSIKLDGPPISRHHLAQILDEDRHPYELSSEGKSSMQGKFQLVFSDLEERALYLSSFEIRFVSLMLENHIDLSFYVIGNSLTIFVSSDVWEKPGSKLRDFIIRNIAVRITEVSYLQNSIGGNQRGRRGRACGLWHPSTRDEFLSSDGSLPLKRVVCLSSLAKKKEIKGFKQIMDKDISTMIDSSLKIGITEEKTRTSFSVTTSGQCRQISQIDLCDLFVAPDLIVNAGESTCRQVIKFPRFQSDVRKDAPRHSRPLIKDAPEGARVMSVLASERRRTTFIRFSDGDNDQFTDVNLPKNFTINGSKWKRKNGGMVFVPENCVPAAVILTDDNVELFGCCANTLELRGGACRVEGITLLPQGRLFVGLALLAFGVNPKTGSLIDTSEINDFIEEEKKDPGSGLQSSSTVDEVWRWIKERDKFSLDQPDRWRVIEALNFHADCMQLGETLECQPDKIRALCALFDGVDGTTMTAWDLDAALSYLSPNPHGKKSQKRNTIANKLRQMPSSWTDGDEVEDVTIPSNQTTTNKQFNSTANAHSNADDTPFKFMFGKDKGSETGNNDRETASKRNRGRARRSRRGEGGEGGCGVDDDEDAAEFIASAIASSSVHSSATVIAPGVSEYENGNGTTQDDRTIHASGKATQKQASSLVTATSFACVECNKIFKKWTTCIRHRDECHPGLHLNQKRSIAHAGTLGSANAPPSVTAASSKAKASEANGRQLHQRGGGRGGRGVVDDDAAQGISKAMQKQRTNTTGGQQPDRANPEPQQQQPPIDERKKRKKKSKGRKNGDVSRGVGCDADAAEFIASVISGW